MLDYLIDEIDLVLVMSVNPGFGGQSFIASQLRKIEAVRKMIDKTGRDIRLEVDGGVECRNRAAVHRCRGRVLVAGSATFKGGPRSLCRQYRRAERERLDHGRQRLRDDLARSARRRCSAAARRSAEEGALSEARKPRTVRPTARPS